MVSEVKQGPNIEAGLSSDQFYYSPNGPVAKAGQEEIVSGFLNAGTGPQNDYSVARQYLTESLKKQWLPNQEVLIGFGRPVVTIVKGDRAQVTLRVQSQLDERGVYSIIEGGAERTLNFALIQENGEWRINEAPNLTVLIRPVFEAIFRSYSLYFFDQQQRTLVPDLRWFPARVSTATRLVTELFNGPSDWLAPAVTTAVPKSVKLSLDSVAASNGVATVDLNSNFLRLSAIEKLRLKAQLTATLAQLPLVNSVQILVERSPQNIGDYAARATQTSPTTPVIFAASGLARLVGALLPNASVIDRIVDENPASDFALSSTESQLALLTESGVRLARLSSLGVSPALVDNRSELLRPRFDRQGYLWVMGASAASQVRVTADSGARSMVDAGWLAWANRREFAISPEGSRIAVLMELPGGTEVWVAAIARDGLGKPIGFGDPHRVAAGLAVPISVAWSGEVQLAVLDATAGTRTTPYLVKLGAEATALPGVEQGVRLISSNDGDLYVQTATGTLLHYRASAWSALAEGVWSAHFSGQ